VTLDKGDYTVSDGIRIISNNQPRPVLDWWELSDKELEPFDYIDWLAVHHAGHSVTFCRYRGVVYDLAEFMTTRLLPEDNPLRDWDGYMSDSFFSGIVVRHVPSEYDNVIVGRFIA